MEPSSDDKQFWNFCSKWSYKMSQTSYRTLCITICTAAKSRSVLHLLTTWHWNYITLVLRPLHWLPVQRWVGFKIACVVHQSLTSTVPMYLSADNQLISEHGRRHLCSSSYRTLAVPCMRTTLGDRSYAVRPRVCSSLPAILWQITSYGHFKQHLKVHILRNCSALWLLIIVHYKNTVTYFLT